ncbi:putative defensin-like protein 244 [Senna tora]|uniref:Putative defensin-like protein 244 n=1 Tax=Senna tora TaxID=362788 RepID=A0A834SYJ6_9FABA|nr:putative defensin-like protein 244 [Senna tora]
MNEGEEPKFCPKKMTLEGKCSVTGGFDCAVEFLGKYGASAMPSHCTCKDLPHHQRLCHCDIICR